MADEKISVTDKKVDAKPKGASKEPWSRGSRMVGIAVAAVLLMCLLVSVFMLGSHSDGRFGEYGYHHSEKAMSARGGSHKNNVDQNSRYGSREGEILDTKAGTASTARVRGVVTAISGDNITVAGDGKTSTVVVTSSTTYSGANKPAQVNDTIFASGSTDASGNLTATTIHLIRR